MNLRMKSETMILFSDVKCFALACDPSGWGSQGLCFVGNLGSVLRLLEPLTPEFVGWIVDHCLDYLISGTTGVIRVLLSVVLRVMWVNSCIHQYRVNICLHTGPAFLVLLDQESGRFCRSPDSGLNLEQKLGSRSQPSP